MATTRKERDSMGEMDVPEEAFYGAQTGRALRNFAISPLKMPRSFIRAMGLIKRGAAQVNMDLKLLNPELGDPIIQASQEVADGKLDDQFVVDVFQTGSGTSTNMNTNEVIAGRSNEILGKGRGGKSPVHPNDAVNMGQSSNDVIPTAIHVSAAEGIAKRLVPELSRLYDALEAKAREFDGIVKIGRTHLQDAVPIRLGQEFSGFAQQVQNGIARLKSIQPRLSEIPIGGTAVGTGINTHADFPARMAAQLTQMTGLEFRPSPNCFEAMANKDAAVETSGALRTVAISLSNIANNLRWLASGPRCGLGEINIPELQPGSSIMPGKVNPVIPEAVLMVGAQVVGNDAAIAWANALGSNFELNVMMPVIAYNLLQSVDLLANAAGHLVDKCVSVAPEVKVFGTVRGVEPHTKRCEELIEWSLAMCTALAPRIGYDAAAAIAKKAHASGKTVRQISMDLVGRTPEDVASALDLDETASSGLRSYGVPSAEEIDRLLEPYGQTVRGTGVGGSGGG